jgi:hypothetical protein
MGQPCEFQVHVEANATTPATSTVQELYVAQDIPPLRLELMEHAPTASESTCGADRRLLSVSVPAAGTQQCPPRSWLVRIHLAHGEGFDAAATTALRHEVQASHVLELAPAEVGVDVAPFGGEGQPGRHRVIEMSLGTGQTQIQACVRTAA